MAKAEQKIRLAAQSCKSFTEIPLEEVIRPIIKELEKEFADFRKIAEENDYRLAGNNTDFFRRWQHYGNSPGSFKKVLFCELRCQCRFLSI
jgi:hypothetical protein